MSEGEENRSTEVQSQEGDPGPPDPVGPELAVAVLLIIATIFIIPWRVGQPAESVLWAGSAATAVLAIPDRTGRWALAGAAVLLAAVGVATLFGSRGGYWWGQASLSGFLSHPSSWPVVLWIVLVFEWLPCVVVVFLLVLYLVRRSSS